MGGAMVSLLFCDLVGSTALLARLGDEAGDIVRRDVFEALRSAVAECGGEEVKNLGDGLMVVFSSASDAVSCGIGMQRALGRLRRRGGDARTLALRVGISAGEATSEDGDWFGTPVVEAARLCAAASSGEVLIGDVVRLLAGSRGGHRYGAPASYELKGLAEPVSACVVEWDEEPEVVASLPGPLQAAGSLAFVGRAAERERLASAWKHAREGQRRLVLLSGEPGAGKTRLAAELARDAVAEGGLVLFGRCDEELGVPYQPFAEALRAHVDQGGADRLGRHAGELARLLPELAELVPGLPEPTVSDPQTEQYRLFDAVAAWLAAAAEERPVLLVLDDAHWASKPTLLLLRHVVRHPDPMRLLVVGTYRDTDLDRVHPLSDMLADFRREPDVERLTLPGLDDGEVASLLESMAGRDLDDAAMALAHAVRAETDGNPFFVGEVLRHLAETGVLYERDGRWTSDRAIEDAGIPEGVREVVGRRVSRLPEGADAVLHAAAVIGQEFELGLLVAVADVPEAEVERVVEEALGAHLLVEVPGRGLRYRFAHALVRATLSDELPGLRRVRLHRTVAEAIERLDAGRLEERAAELAHHWGEAAASSGADQAVHWAMRAGAQCLARLADEQAMVWVERASELLDDAGEPVGTLRRCDVLMLRAEAARRVGRPYREAMLSAADIAISHGDGERVAAALLSGNRGMSSVNGLLDSELVHRIETALGLVDEGSPSHARLLALLSQELTYGPDPERRFASGRRAIELARASGDPVLLRDAHALTVLSLFDPSQPEERLERTDELLALAEQLGDARWAAQGRLWRWWVLTELGRLEEAQAATEELRRRVDALGHVTLRWLASNQQAAEAMHRGDFAVGIERAQETMALGLSAGEPDAGMFASVQWFDMAVDVAPGIGPMVEALAQQAEQFPGTPGWRSALASALVEAGRAEEGNEALDVLVARWGYSMPMDPNWYSSMFGFCWAIDALNRVDLAEPVVRAMLPFSGRPSAHVVFMLGSVDLALGKLCRGLGRHDDALRHLAAARDLHERMRSPRWAAHADWESARVLRERDAPGDIERAAEWEAAARAVAERLGMTAFLERMDRSG